ncbi:hypothetical protein [Aestuariivivens sediminicola]|uniref:hypothetical protein n=1 Tax=Aestuariivivens sediminicola TaxID=2913560 RepID=UPI001F579098|nr:hypothetical protein [Aestuariivivens sediminicola]
MKKILSLIMITLSVIVLTNCEENEITPKVSEIDYVGFEVDPAEIAVPLNGSLTQDISIYSSTISSSARTFNVVIDPSSTASPATYNMASSITIPANSNKGTLSIELVDDSIGNGVTLVLNVSSSDDATFVGEPITLTIIRDCPSDLAGTYSVVSNGTSTDGAPANNPLVNFAYEVVITQTGPISYSISDGVAGVYIDWYCAPYGYCFETPGTFSEICGVLTGSWVEAFGAQVRLSGVNNFDGTLTISWDNDFGDTATATYTKL